MKRTFIALLLVLSSLLMAQTPDRNPGSNIPNPSDKLWLQVYGSSTPAGTGASDNAHSFVGLMTVSLAALANPWTVTNYAVGGTTSAQMLAAVKLHALVERPTAVLLMPSLGNESNISSAGDTALTAYKSNLQQAIQSCRAAGIFVFLGTSPPRTDITTITTTYGATTLQQLQQNLVSEEESWQGAEILVDATDMLGDGAGSYLAAYTGDNLHPNDTGHAALAASIPISRFNNLWAWNWSSIKGLSRFGTRIPNSTANSDIPWKIVLANSTSNSFSVSFWLKRDTFGVLSSYLGLSSTQALRLFQNPNQLSVFGNDGSQVFNETGTFNRMADMGWHHIAIVYRKQDTKFWVYLDGILNGTAQTQASALTTALDQIYVGTRASGTSPARNCWYRDFNFYLRPLWQADVTKLIKGDAPWGGLDCSLPLSATGVIGCRSPNNAATDTFAVAGLTMDTLPAPVLPAGGLGVKVDGAIAENFPRRQATGNITPLTSGQAFMTPITFAEPTTVTNLSFCSGTQAAVSPTHWFYAIYDSKLNLIAQTADQTSTAWAANTVKTLALTAAQNLPAGTYYAQIMMTAGTVISMRGMTGIDTTIGALSTAMAGTSTGSLTTTAPNPAGAITVTTADPWCYAS